MDKSAFRSTVKGKLNNHGGFSYLEMLMVVFILSLCTGVISDTLALGVKHLQERTKQTQAIILLDTLFASVRNDLIYATPPPNADKSFDHAVRDNIQNFTYSVTTLYGVADEWPKDRSDNYQNPPPGWEPVTSITNESPKKGQIIRENTLPSAVTYYEPVTSVENYSGYGITGGITSGNKLRATIRMDYDTTRGEFHVIIQIFNEKNVKLCEKDQWIKSA